MNETSTVLAPPRATGEPPLELIASRQFTSWLAEQQISLAFTTYRAGKLFLIGRKPDGQISGFERTFERTMGLWSDGQTMWMGSIYQIWRLENSLLPGQTVDGYDRLYVPRVGFTTGDVDVHDLAVDSNGRLVFVNTLFSCLARVSDRYSFQALWHPPFITKLAAEDRCHLNGLAIRGGRPWYVTACSKTDWYDGWRDYRSGGGCVMDIETNEIVCEGLSMPNSPRWHHDRLWLLDAGSGFFGYIDIDHGRFERVTFCPGYARGLAFVGDFAIIGVSKCRHERTLAGLQLEDNLRRRQGENRCGLIVVNTRTGDIEHWFRLEGVIQELHDVAVLPGVVRPKALGFKTADIQHLVCFENQGEATTWVAEPNDTKAKKEES